MLCIDANTHTLCIYIIYVLYIVKCIKHHAAVPILHGGAWAYIDKKTTQTLMRPGWAVVKLCLFDSVKTFIFFPNAIVYSSICRCCVNDIDIDVYLWPMLLGASPATVAAAAAGQRIFIRLRARSWTRIFCVTLERLIVNRDCSL